MIDLHCHIDLYQEPRAIVAEIVRKQCIVFAVTTTPQAWGGTTKVINNAPGIKIGLGLHPELVARRAQEVRQLLELLPQAAFIGEIGLDGSHRHRSSLPLQVEVFQIILGAASKIGGRIISIHSKGAAKETLDQLEQHVGDNVPVLHWFSGTQKELLRAIDLGCWFSVGPSMLAGDKGKALVAHMPIDRVVTETDGPFTRNGVDPLYPWDVDKAECILSEIWKRDALAVRQLVRKNFLDLSIRAGMP